MGGSVGGGGVGGGGGMVGVLGWGKILLVVSVILMLGSAAYEIGFADRGEGQAAGISRVIFSVGFSYLIGYVVAYAMRTALLTVFLVCGFMIIVLLGMQFLGLVEIKWNLMQRSNEGAGVGSGVGGLGGQSRWMKAYVNGALLSVVAGCVGLFAGWGRK